MPLLVLSPHLLKKHFFKIFNRVPSGGRLTVDHVIKVLEKRFPYVEVSSVVGVDSSYDNNRKVRRAQSSLLPHSIQHLCMRFQEGRAYYEQTGVGPLPVVMYNGIPYQREHLEPDELETITMQKILETTSFYQRAVYLVSWNTFKDMPDSFTVLLGILKKS